MFSETWLRQYRERKHKLNPLFVAEIEKAIREHKRDGQPTNKRKTMDN